MPLRRRRILVVDHDTVTGAAAAAQLRLDERHDVLLVHAAAGARQTIESADARFDLLITELDLGDGDGLTVLLSALKLDSPPLLVLVSNADPEVLTPIQDMVSQASGRPLILLSKPLVPALLEPVLQQMRSILPDLSEDEPCRPIEEIESAMRSREFVLVLEPQIDLQTGVVAGFEALARWQHPSRGLLGPHQFIPAIEQSALMPAFTLMMFESLLLTRRHLFAHGYEGSLSFNLSPLCFAEERFADEMMARVTHMNDSAQHYVLELTETADDQNAMNAVAVMARLRMHGFRLSVDDFGMGYASMLRMQSAAFSQVKIDRQFASRVESDRISRAAIEAAVVIGRNLGWTTVAEGVDCASQITHLRLLGCGLGQGYLFSRPLGTDDATLWWRSWMENPAESLRRLMQDDPVARPDRSQTPGLPALPAADIQAMSRRHNAVWIFDLQQFGMVWANDAGVRFWRADSLAELLGRDFASDMSTTTQERLTAYRSLLIEQGPRQSRWTLYPRGIPQLVDCIVSPVEMPDRGICMQVDAFPVGAVMTSDRLDLEIARMSAAAIVVFDLAGVVIWQNPAAHGLFHRLLSQLVDALSVASEVEELLALARSDRQSISDRRLLCGNGSAWYRLQMRQARNPVSGGAVVVCSFTPVDDLLGLAAG